MSRNRRRHKLRRKAGLDAVAPVVATPPAATAASSQSAPSVPSVANDQNDD
jgi:hypothetical protein